MQLKPAAIGQKEILRNLLEKYLYEFSQYDGARTDELGLFGYRYLDAYWQEEGRWPFLLWEEDRPIGFALVNRHIEGPEAAEYSMAEFFVLYDRRRTGAGGSAVQQLFDKFPGKWEIKYHKKNEGSVHFWHKMAALRDANYRHICSGTVLYEDGTPAEFLYVNA